MAQEARSRATRRWIAHLALTTTTLALLAWSLGCAAELESGASASDDAQNPSPGDSGNNNPNNSASANNQAGNNPGNNNPANNAFIPEPEERFDFQAPRSSRNYVFVVNTSLDAVAKVDARTLEITSIEVGDRPTTVRTHRPENLAVVLSEGSHEASIIRAGDARDYVVHLELPPGLNALEINPTGEWALAWFDFDRAQADPDTVIGSSPPFQDVALIRLTEGQEEVIRLTVGFQVLGVTFDDDGEQAFIITRTGVSVAALGEIDSDRALPPVPVADAGIEDELEREVAITGDGRYAFVRSGGLQGINIVDLQTQDIALVTLSAVPTDLDIVPGEPRALAVIRQSGELALIELPSALDAPEAVQIIALGDEPAGQAELTADARKALVFTAAEERKAITLVDLEDATFQTYPLRKGIRSVAIAPWGTGAVILHTKQPGDPAPGLNQDELIARSWGYSVFDLETGFAKLTTVPSEPGELLFTQEEERRRLYILFNDPAQDVRQVEIIDLASLNTQTLRLGSPPEHVGLIPNDGTPRVYISQEHPAGRMTFINEASAEVKTVTGYQLNSLIE